MPMRRPVRLPQAEIVHHFPSSESIISRRQDLFFEQFILGRVRAPLNDATAQADAYPSPPMSESHLPSKFINGRRDSRDDAGSSYNPTFQDGYTRNRPDGQPDDEGMQQSHRHDSRQGLSHGMPTQYDFKQGEGQPTGYRPVPSSAGFATSSTYEQHSPVTGMSAGQAYHSHASGSSSGFQETEYFGSKSQRKVKGHVASACVPCKRAHLRCDAQRPCSRCVSSGKVDTCIDVQHKKRGRPRLRDDRDARFEEVRGSNAQESSFRQPTNIHPSGGSTGPAPSFQDDTFGRRSSFRGPQGPQGPMSSAMPTPRFHSASPSPSTQHSSAGEPVAYLTMKLDFVSASIPFLEATGLPGVLGLRLADVLVPADRPRVSKIESEAAYEQKRREPNYLPPILGNGHREIQSLGFTLTEPQRASLLNVYERLNFVGAGGNVKPQTLRVGLGKEASFYFVILLLDMPPLRNHHPGSWYEGQGLPHRPPPFDAYRPAPGPPPPLMMNRPPPHGTHGSAYEGQMGPPNPSWDPRHPRHLPPPEHAAHYQAIHATRQYPPPPSPRHPQPPLQSAVPADTREGGTGAARAPSRRVDIQGLLDDDDDDDDDV